MIHNKTQTHNRKSIIVAGIVIILVILLAIFAVRELRHRHEAATSVAIIIAPNLNDAVVSLGGMIAVNTRPTIIEDFFDASSSSSSVATPIAHASVQFLGYNSASYGGASSTEETDLAQNIQAIIAGNQGKNIYVYGPATFTTALNDPDTQILHQAFLDVATGYVSTSTQFFIYENYPAIQEFNQAIVYSLKKNLQNESDQAGTALSFSEVDIPLSPADVSKKVSELTALGESSTTIAGDEAFTNSRCPGDANQACEAVYEIIQVPVVAASSSVPY